MKKIKSEQANLDALKIDYLAEGLVAVMPRNISDALIKVAGAAREVRPIGLIPPDGVLAKAVRKLDAALGELEAQV